MNKQLRRLGFGLLACYLALFAMVNYVQVFHAEALNERSDNPRRVVRDFDRPRGQIVSADGAVLAHSVLSPPGDPYKYQREYPEGDLFGHITGYFNISFGATGVEEQYNDELSGAQVSQQYETLRDLFVDRDHTGDVNLTLRKDLQQEARDQLGDRKGSVVVLDPRSGEILAMWSNPSYDPNPLASHNQTAAQTAKTLNDLNPDHPLRGKTWQERFFPGSTFKVVTGSTGVETGTVTPDNPSYPTATAYKPPDGQPISNFGGESCGGSLFHILEVSCNSAFAQMGAETIGHAKMLAGAQAFGFNSRPPIDLPDAATSAYPDTNSKAFTGQASIGQFDVAASPLQMAMVASAVANKGVIMTPHVMKEIRDDTGKVIKTYNPTPWKSALSPQTADTMREAMIGVVESGTGTAAQIQGVEVAGKTGTAQLGTDPPTSHAWFICFAGPPGGQPTVAVAVIVEAQSGASESTGGRIAAPIAKDMVQKTLDIQAGG